MIENEVVANDTIATAQVIATLPANVSGSISSNADLDHFKVSIAAGKKLTVTLTAGPSSGFGVGVFTTTGQQLILIPGVAGRTALVQITNSGGTAAQMVIRALRSTGAIGADKLSLAY